MLQTSEQLSPEAELLRPGNVIELDSVMQLHAFEDCIAPMVEPNLHWDIWQTRPPLKEALRWPGHSGNITDVSLKVMADPIDRLNDARERGWVFLSFGTKGFRPSKGITHRMEPLTRGEALGFEYQATANSTGRGAIDTISAEIWYLPYNNLKPALAKGVALRRITTAPRLETGELADLRDRSQRIGFKLLQQAMMHPILTSHRG